MTTARRPLTDDLLRRALQELAAGPDDTVLTTDVMQAVAVTPQARGLIVPRLFGGRTSLLVAAVLLVSLVGALVATGTWPSPIVVPFQPQTIVVQSWNGERGAASVITNSAFAPGSDIGLPLTRPGISSSAVGLRWSPDGKYLVYFTRYAPPEWSRGFRYTGVFIVDGNGATPPVPIQHPVANYVSNGWWSGVVWSPTGDQFALVWDTGGCSSGPDCIPPTGIDIFDTTGALVAQIAITDGMGGLQWSPDGTAVGWATGFCRDSLCQSDAYHWQRLADGAVTTLPLAASSSVIWSDDNRLLVTTLRTEQRTVGNGIYMDTFVERIYTMAPDGSDEREVAWTDATADRIPAWSPDGRWLAVVDSTAGVLTVHEVATGEDTVTAIPVNLTFGAWSPDSDRLMLFGGGDGPDGYSLYVINVDGSGFLPLGDGGDFSWMPASVTGPNEPQ